MTAKTGFEFDRSDGLPKPKYLCAFIDFLSDSPGLMLFSNLPSRKIFCI